MAKNKEALNELDDEDTGSLIEFSEDISEAEAPEPLPERDYPSTISKVETRTSAKGNTYLAVFFRIEEEDYPADYDPNNNPGGAEIMHMLGIDDNARSRFRMRKFCEAIGAPMSRQINTQDWVGLGATVSIKHDTYEGVTREKIAKVSAA